VSKSKVLVVDDNDSYLELAELRGKKVGHHVQTADGGKSALKLVEKEAEKGGFDFAFVDFMMPEMNGIEVCEEIHKVSPKTQLVLISGVLHLVGREQLHSFYKNGGREVLEKNGDGGQITDTIEKLLGERTRNG